MLFRRIMHGLLASLWLVAWPASADLAPRGDTSKWSDAASPALVHAQRPGERRLPALGSPAALPSVLRLPLPDQRLADPASLVELTPPAPRATGRGARAPPA